jgi:hypothetical protein
MVTVKLVLLVLALVLFGLAALGVPSSRINLVAGGLLCWCLSTVV